ncbi:hypothetical protein [Candidatus Contubernalis alkaliaceticus]|uniref:hypothetical protein n=1 Tax=Candidatus Contubernalis alkaliaceticus TaxID=338645 RepID=UPI001F4C406D|nr:hypothetical protein [Candidatus Contubernalis alkalaceticus]UNC92028.1 hypothetical protein HUE98_07910 [Candidatus Contubernalis alkalaceticus]
MSIEYIFDTENIDLSEMKLMGFFISSGNYIEGDWRSTFHLEAVKEEKQREYNIEFDTWTASQVSISPMGITLVGRGEIDGIEKIVNSANMMDGSVKTFDSMMRYRENKEIRLKVTSSLPLDISKVESINIDGHIIEFN